MLLGFVAAQSAAVLCFAGSGCETGIGLALEKSALLCQKRQPRGFLSGAFL